MSSPLHLATRSATASDMPLLQRLFDAQGVAEFAALGLPPAQLQPLIEMQFRARQQGYALTYPNAVDTILCLADGTAIGRCLIHRDETSLRIIDVALLPDYRNQRIGVWAIHTAQLEAARANLALHLRVIKTNPALRLYKRQGFTIVSQDDLSFEMEWRQLPSAPGLSHAVMTTRITGFLQSIGFEIRFSPLNINGFLPGIQMVSNGLIIDRDRLLYPGDLLHEAGHLAVMPPAQRHSGLPEPTEMGEEIAATAWSYAAAIHLGIPVQQVIHDNGFRGSAATLREALGTGRGVGIPLLQWMQLTQERAEGIADDRCFPNMRQWLRAGPERSQQEAVRGMLHITTPARTLGRPSQDGPVAIDAAAHKPEPMRSTSKTRRPPTPELLSFQCFSYNPFAMKNVCQKSAPKSFLFNILRKVGGGGVLLLASAAAAQNAAQQKALQALAHPNVSEPNGVEATTVPLAAPAGLAYDAAGNLFIASLNDNLIRKVDLKGIITTVAGTGEQGFSGDGGPALSAVLDSPAGVALDSAGNIYIADTHNNRIREVFAATGTINTIAGSSTAGFSGDGAAATSAQLNLPLAVALDSAGNIYIADTHNSRIRKIAAGTITTVAGNGDQGYEGDGVLATTTGLDTPSGLALDAAGSLYIGDTHNQRVRLVTASTGIITTLAGNGTRSFSGDAGAAAAAALDRPRGLAVDNTGKLYIADSDNNRIRTVTTTGTIATLAGTGEQGFSGDNGQAAAAILDTPRSAATFGSGTSTAIAFTDSNNSRARAVSSNGNITTIAGIGATGTEQLALSGATTDVYGTGSLIATFLPSGTSNATGSITLTEGGATISTGNLNANAATLALSSLPAGQHTVVANYPGDSNNAAISSGNFIVTITPAPLVATANAVTIAYGQAVPALTGTLAGVLPQDAGNVAAVFASTATSTSAPAIYPITVSLTGTAAANYNVTLAAASGSLTITQATSTTTLTTSTTTPSVATAVTFTVKVASTTTGTPGGSVQLFLNASTTPLATLTLTAGSATYTTAALPAGTDTLTAVYTGDANFTASTSNTVTETVLYSDFTFVFSAVGSVTQSQTVSPGSTATYNFALTPALATFPQAVTFTATGGPTGAIYTFTPTSVAAGSTPQAVLLAIAVPASHSQLLHRGEVGTVVFGLLLLPFGARRFRKRRTLLRSSLAVFFFCITAALTGCGSSGFFNQPQQTYTIVVTATSGNISHTANVTLIVQ